ncbi:MAG TPA: hypothetical protein VFU14_12860 [Acidimicrobiales bacterium]|nr:hypothetical protein [Acidimicrobiales bacterium]
MSFSSGGLAFAAKRQPHALARVEARLDPLRQHLSLAGDTPRPWRVDLGDSEELKLRLAELRSSSRRRRWRPEDLGAFAAAAIWTYLTMPLLLDRAEHLERLRDAGGARRLRVTLPTTLAGHGSVQTLHIGPDSLISRHDYTAMAFGTWARASQRITSYETFDGVPIGTCRVVRPRLGPPLPVPTLVWIKVHSMQVARRA